MTSNVVTKSIALGVLSALGALLAGCSGGQDATASGGLTYYKDVKPLVDAKCTSCHTAGGIAPFALTSYADVQKQAAAMKGAVGSAIMPPWPPASGCSDYKGNRSLSPEQIATLTKWVDEGAVEGDPSEKPNVVADDSLRLSRVDLTLTMPDAYTPELSPDEYRCFLVDWPNAETTYVTGVGVTPGAPSIVHHVIAFLATPDKVAAYQALDDAEPGPGYTCFGGPGGGGRPGWVGAWAPGSQGSDFPAGTGIEIPPGSKIVVQVHYNTLSSPAVPDQSSILLETEKTVAKKAVIVPWADPGWITNKTMDIPAHAMDATYHFELDPTPYMSTVTGGVLQNSTPFTIYGAGLHMHTRGTHALTRIERAGGANECMLDIEQWNFHWQGSYQFTEPKTFEPGDKLYLECHWDNPGATALNWGEGTGDEMCLGVFYATQ